MKKLAAMLFAALICCFALPTSAISISAQYACVLDAQTGKILYEKNSNVTHSMASTTKIMTALLALEQSSFDDVVTVSPNAAGTEGSSIYLAAGEKIKMETLLYGLMLESGNDAAIAIAEHIGGSVPQFATMMTERAHALGAKNTAFKNPNGLDEEGHYTTAYDLALLTKAALDNPEFKAIASTKRKSFPATDGYKARSFSNHNKLLSLYPGCIGVKTGFTKKTGRCLVSAATRENVTAICVTLNAPNDWDDHTRLLDDAFSSVIARPVVIQDMVLKTVPIKNGSVKSLDLVAAKDFHLTFSKNEGLSKVKLNYKIPAEITAPISAGTPLGKLSVLYDGKVLGDIDLLAAIDVFYQEPPKPDFFRNFRKIFENLLNWEEN